MTKENNKIVAFKAMNNDMTCRGFQYEIGKEYQINGDIKVCRNGFHSCENSLDVLNYYPRNSKFFKVLAGGKIEKEDDKIVSSSIYIDCEISFSCMFDSFFDKIIKLCYTSKDANTSGDCAHANTSGNKSHANTSGDCAHANTSGDCAHANTSGDYAHANTSGNYAHANTSGFNAHANTSGFNAHANTSGNKSHANTSGNYAHANTSGDYAHANTSGNYTHANTSGNYAHANTSGDCAHANTSGNYAHANTSGDCAHANTSGKNSIASAIGYQSKAKADSKNSWINIFNWVYEDGDYIIKEGFAKKPGQELKGKIIKVGYWYWFESGKLMEEKG
jgi:hypothetical protein